jgi:uncharacterized membrane protein YfbV (UPF0208 family)
MPRHLQIAILGAVVLTVAFALMAGGSLGALELAALLVAWFALLLASQGVVQLVRRRLS